MPFFKTTVYAALILGTIAGILMFAIGTWWLMSCAKAANARGEFYGDHPNEVVKEFDSANLPNVWVALMPIAIVLVLNFILSEYVFTANAAGYDYLKNKPFETNLGAVRGIRSLVISWSWPSFSPLPSTGSALPTSRNRSIQACSVRCYPSSIPRAKRATEMS